jgi:hypothetical protein
MRTGKVPDHDARPGLFLFEELLSSYLDFLVKKSIGKERDQPIYRSVCSVSSPLSECNKVAVAVVVKIPEDFPEAQASLARVTAEMKMFCAL